MEVCCIYCAELWPGGQDKDSHPYVEYYVAQGFRVCIYIYRIEIMKVSIISITITIKDGIRLVHSSLL